MARPALATIDDLEARLGESVTNPAQAAARLQDASAIVRAWAGLTWLDAGGALSGVPDDIPGIVAGMVERASRNPDALTSETAGPFVRSFGPDASQRLFLTAMDKLVIKGATGRSGIGTLSTTRGCIPDTPSVIPWWDPFGVGDPDIFWEGGEELLDGSAVLPEEGDLSGW